MHEIEIQSACKSGILLSLAMLPGEASSSITRRANSSYLALNPDESRVGRKMGDAGGDMG
jgi:hypothetical protein